MDDAAGTEAMQIAVGDASFCLVDELDFEVLSKRRWRLDKEGYVITGWTPRVERMHRVIVGLTQADQRIVDHANGDKLDNRRKNLRICSRAQNGQNRGRQRNNRSGFKGVHWVEREGKWRAQITVERSRKTIGDFDTAEEAHAAYCAFAKKLHGEYANFG
jgi:hypothetical protein